MNVRFMDLALKEAKKAYLNGDIPVGAVIVKDGNVIAKAYNKKHKTKDSTNHAEILAIKKASKVLKDFRLEGCEMYITLEPCIMCYGAILSARIEKVYFGAYDKKFSIIEVSDAIKFNHNTQLVGGVKEQECSNLLSNFFEELRRKNADSITKSGD